jgi:hypothetical protein
MANYINSDILKLLKGRYWVIFTNQNPDAKKLSEVENASLYRQLVQSYRDAKLPFETVVGRYNGNYEDGIILFTLKEVTRQDAADLAKLYGQESVLTYEGLVYQDGSCNPVIDWVFPCSEPEDNYTLLRSTYFRADIDWSKKI